MITCGLTLVKQFPKLLALILTIVNIALIFFVLNGATHDSSAYNSLALIEYKFNSSSDIYSLLSLQYSKNHSHEKLDEFVIKVGYRGVCISFTDGKDNLNCGYTSDMDAAYSSKVPSFSVTDNNNSTGRASLEMFDIAYSIQEKSYKSNIYIAELICLLAALICQVYTILGFLPFQNYVLLLILGVLTSFFIINCIAITWLMVVLGNLVGVGGVLTMNILSFTVVSKPVGILWATLAITIVQGSLYLWHFLGGNIKVKSKNSTTSKVDMASTDLHRGISDYFPNKFARGAGYGRYGEYGRYGGHGRYDGYGRNEDYGPSGPGYIINPSLKHAWDFERGPTSYDNSVLSSITTLRGTL